MSIYNATHSGLQGFYAKFSRYPYGVSLLCDSVISLAAFRIFSLFLTPAILIILYLSVGLFWFILFGTQCDFCTVFWFGKFSAIISSNTTYHLFSLLFFRDTYNMNADKLNVISRSLKLFSFFWGGVSFSYSDWWFPLLFSPVLLSGLLLILVFYFC